MPQQIGDPTPSWLKAENASVTDSALTKALRMIGHAIGADNPTAQVFGLMMTDLPGGSPTGGLAKAVEKLVERAKGITAYHGSPHDFEKFSTAKIGTGEGAQAYGHGLYFADLPEVSRGYRDQVAVAGRLTGEPLDTDMRIGGKLVTDVYAAIERQAARMPAKAAEPLYERLSALESLMQHGDALGVQEAAQAGQVSPEALAWFQKDIAPNFTRKGKLFEVNIKSEPEKFLDWDKPLSQQSESVQSALAELDPDQWHPSGGDYDANETGQSVYHRLWETRIKSGAAKPAKIKQAEVSAALAKKGIPGIKYLDQGSRAAGEGSRNYVVFDDQLVDILKKYGLLLPAAGLAGSEQH